VGQDGGVEVGHELVQGKAVAVEYDGGPGPG